MSTIKENNVTVLNLDDLTSPERAIKIKGINYPIKKNTVKDFIDNAKEAKALVESTEDESVALEHTVSLIQKMIPSISKENIECLSLDQMNAIIEFIMSSDEQGSEELPKKK